MAYDFQAAIAAAKAVVEKSEGAQSTQYKYPLVYPPAGQSITVRLLFNPASGQIVRLVNRHEKIPCYRTYGIECPICKMMQQVKDTTGQDPFGRQKASRSRGIAFAQFMNSTAPIDKGNNKGYLQPGETILLMFPWSVYQQINAQIQAVAQTPTGMDQAFCHAQSGMFIQITTTADFKYTTTLVPYMQSPIVQSDEDFMKMLDSMDSLNDQVVPGQITQEVDKQVKEYADAIYRQYIVPRTPSQTPPQAPQNFGQSVPTPTYTPVSAGQSYSPVPDPLTPPWEVSAPPATQNAPATTVESTTPACMGQHKQNEPKCICCPLEMQCMTKTGQ